MGAEGFEPPSAGYAYTDGQAVHRVIAPVIHHRSANPLRLIPLVTGARQDPGLPYAPTGLSLAHPLLALPAAHPLLAPFPTHLPALLPRAEAPLYGITQRP